MSKQRADGTAFENKVRDRYLRGPWPKAERAAQSGINDYGDFINVDGWLVEAKNRGKWDLPSWLRTIYTKISKRHVTKYGQPWVLFFKQKPMRDLGEDLVLMPAWLATELLEEYPLKHALAHFTGEEI